MHTDKPNNTFPILQDAAAFLITVAVCAFLLYSGRVFAPAVVDATVTPPAIAVPLPPTTIALLPEPPAITATAGTESAAGEPERQRPLTAAAPDVPVPEEQPPYHGIITQVAGRYEVDPSLIRAIIFAESGFNPRAKSKKGARGLMQLMPSTARSLGVQDVYDPEENIEGGVKYFRLLLDRFDGDVRLALAAYNAGSRHVRNYEGIPPFKATRRYIKKVLKFQQKFKMEWHATARRLA